jgi:tetratricopeptide (TPR) repeat protein
MLSRLGLSLLCLICWGSRGLIAADIPDLDNAAGELWEAGQEAMRHSQPKEAITFYKKSLAVDPKMSCNHLSIAAAYLEMNDLESACPFLSRYLLLNPRQLLIRARYAELLARLNHLQDAQSEYERFIAEAQQEGGPAAQQLIHCHTRLVEIAEESNDDYNEHLHRGIGLYLIARKRAMLPDAGGELPSESLLCKAAAELTLAHQERPGLARPSWYLYEVWRLLGQQQPAVCRLRQAQALEPFTDLTPGEASSLTLAFASFLSELKHP